MTIFRIIPLLILPVIMYFIIVAAGGDTTPGELFNNSLFEIPMPNDGRWIITGGDLLITFALICLSLEVIKATYTRGSALADQALSIILLVISIVCFLLLPLAQSSEFFILMVIILIDVITGAIVGIRTARRDIGFGAGGDLG